MKKTLSPEEVRRHFPQFTEPELQAKIADLGRLHHLSEGDTMLDYGSYVRSMPLILAGSIKISREADDGSELFLYYLNPG